jgi:hypothetical protein
MAGNPAGVDQSRVNVAARKTPARRGIFLPWRMVLVQRINAMFIAGHEAHEAGKFKAGLLK